MMTKAAIVLAFVAGLLTAHVVTPEEQASAPEDIQVDCEYLVTPKGMTLVKGGETC